MFPLPHENSISLSGSEKAKRLTISHLEFCNNNLKSFALATAKEE